MAMSHGALAGGSLFVGLMVATAVRSLVPAVTLVTAPFLCEGGGAQVHSSWYRCLDGVKSTVPTVLPVSDDMPDIIVVIAVTTLIYGAGAYVLGLVAKLLTGSSAKR